MGPGYNYGFTVSHVRHQILLTCKHVPGTCSYTHKHTRTYTSDISILIIEINFFSELFKKKKLQKKKRKSFERVHNDSLIELSSAEDERNKTICKDAKSLNKY